MKIERLLGIVVYLLNRELVNANTLAEKLTKHCGQWNLLEQYLNVMLGICLRIAVIRKIIDCLKLYE